MTLSEVADILHTTPHLKDSSVVECQTSFTDEKKKGDGTLQNTDTQRGTEFTVFLASWSCGVFATGSTLAEALHKAFRDLNEKDSAVKMPLSLKANFPFQLQPKTK